MGSIVGAVHEPPLQMRRNDEVEAQCRRWTFYETLKIRKERKHKGWIKSLLP